MSVLEAAGAAAFACLGVCRPPAERRKGASISGFDPMSTHLLPGGHRCPDGHRVAGGQPPAGLPDNTDIGGFGTRMKPRSAVAVIRVPAVNTMAVHVRQTFVACVSVQLVHAVGHADLAGSTAPGRHSTAGGRHSVAAAVHRRRAATVHGGCAATVDRCCTGGFAFIAVISVAEQSGISTGGRDAHGCHAEYRCWDSIHETDLSGDDRERSRKGLPGGSVKSRHGRSVSTKWRSAAGA